MDVQQWSAQTTIKEPLSWKGIGVHSGAEAQIFLKEAPAWTGIQFVLPCGAQIPADVSHVVDSKLSTTLGNGDASVRTVEHLLAALLGMGVHNAYIHVDGPEIPIMDGSAACFVERIAHVGIRKLHAPLPYRYLKAGLRLSFGESWVSFMPAFSSVYKVIVRMHNKEHEFSFDPLKDNFAKEIGPCRTFAFRHEIDMLRAQGLIQGGSLENAVVWDGEAVLNPEGLRYENESIRHKLLDLVGDFALLKYPLLAQIEAFLPSHRVNILAVKALLEKHELWEWKYRSDYSQSNHTHTGPKQFASVPEGIKTLL